MLEVNVKIISSLAPQSCGEESWDPTSGLDEDDRDIDVELL